MSRVIKFRVWQRGERVEWASFTHHSCLGIDEIFEQKGFIFEQFIGLQDKNGKDIYEGDIVRVQGWAMPCVVTYHFGGFVCSYSWTVKDKDKEERVETANISMAYFAGAYLDHLEVVGNIHENPEMMK